MKHETVLGGLSTCKFVLREKIYAYENTRFLGVHKTVDSLRQLLRRKLKNIRWEMYTVRCQGSTQGIRWHVILKDAIQKSKECARSGKNWMSC